MADGLLQIFDNHADAFCTLIGFIISYIAIFTQNHLDFKREIKHQLIENRKSVYLDALKFIQDYETTRKNNKKQAISKEDIHSQIYNLLAPIEIYGSKKVIKTFNQCKSDIRNQKTDGNFRKLVDAIREDLKVKD